MQQDQQTFSLLVRRFNDPPAADFTQNRRYPEAFWRDKFNELTERDQILASILARVETNVSITKVELQEQLEGISDSLSQLNDVSDRVGKLQQEINRKREQYDAIKRRAEELKSAIEMLSEKITDLEATNRYLRRERALFDANIIALIILAAIVLYHVFFG